MADFIVFEGIDCSGKTTQIKLLYEAMRKQGFSVLLTREPFQQNIYDMCQKMLTDNSLINSHLQLLLIINDRMKHTEYIAKNFNNYDCIISDRYYYSTLAYNCQGWSHFRDENVMQKIQKMRLVAEIHHNFCIEPNIVFYLKTSIEEAKRRERAAQREERASQDEEKYNARNACYATEEGEKWMRQISDNYDYIFDESNPLDLPGLTAYYTIREAHASQVADEILRIMDGFWDIMRIIKDTNAQV